MYNWRIIKSCPCNQNYTKNLKNFYVDFQWHFNSRWLRSTEELRYIFWYTFKGLKINVSPSWFAFFYSWQYICFRFFIIHQTGTSICYLLTHVKTPFLFQLHFYLLVWYSLSNIPNLGFCDPEIYLFPFLDDRPFLLLRK